MKRCRNEFRNTVSERGNDFETVEEPLDFAGAIRAADCDALVVDCLTLWLSNTMDVADKTDGDYRGGKKEPCRDNLCHQRSRVRNCA